MARILFLRKASRQVRLGRLNQSERQAVRRFVGVAPGHEPVLSKDDGTSTGERGDLPRKVESRSHVRHNRDVVAERGPDMSSWLSVVRQSADDVGVDVIYVRAGRKA